MLSEELKRRLRERAADPDRRTDGSGIATHAMDFGLLGQLGSAGAHFQSMQSQLSGLMSQFAGIMKGFGVENPLPQPRSAEERRATAPVLSPATEQAVSEAEAKLGFALPAALRQLYSEVADGGFGPGEGLYPLVQLVAQYRDFTEEPFGPQGQSWPANLLPICHDDLGEICLDRDTGEIIFWDPEELAEGASNKYWLRSFKDEASDLVELLDKWVDSPTAMERMKAQRDAVMANPMQTHINNMIDCCSRMTPDERAAMGFDGDDWQDKIRQKYSSL